MATPGTTTTRCCSRSPSTALAKVAPPGYQSDMPAFEGTLTDPDIVAVLAFIKSRWPAVMHDKRREAGMN